MSERGIEGVGRPVRGWGIGHWHRLVLACLAALLLGLASAPPLGAEPSPRMAKKVLILHSYYKGFPWTDSEHQGIVSVLGPAVGMENIYVEYLDIKRFYWDDYLVQLAQMFRQKYRAYRPDLVLVTDNNAFDFMRRFGEDLFPGVPVVFCGVNYAREEDLAGHPNFTGVSEEADLEGSLRVALALCPGTRHVYVVNDCTETGRAVAERFRTLVPAHPGLDIVMLEGLDLDTILARLRQMPPRSIVFHTFYGRDCAGRPYDYDRSTPLIVGATEAPVFAAWDFNLGYGVVGGVLTRGTDNGAAAGQIALRVLAGERPSDIGILRDVPGRLLFDHSALARHGIAASSLPEGSQVINRPESPFTRYRTLLVSLAGIVAFLITVIAVLSANISRRKQAEDDLLQYQGHLEEVVQERSAQLQDANRDLQRDLRARERAEQALRRAEANLRNIFDHAAEGIYQATLEGRFLTVNAALARMAGYPSPQAMVESVGDLRTEFYVDPDLRREFEAQLVSRGELGGHESRVRRTDGTTLWILESARARRNAQGELEHFEGFIQDITARRQWEDALRDSREILDKTFASLLDALLIVDAEDRTIRDCNPATRRLFGYEREELIGRSTRMLHVDEAAYRLLELRALEAFPARGFLNLPNFQMRRKDGEVFVSELALMPLHDKHGAMTSWVCVVRDITEQRLMEAKLDLTRRKLRALAAELTSVEERERRVIATQLHDGLGAVLAMGKVKLATVLKAAQGGPLAPAVEEIHGLIGEAVEATRSLTWELSPPILYQLGLSAAAEWLCEDCERKHGLPVRFNILGEPRELSDELRFLLFSAIRELLLNIVKHAEASEVSVVLAWNETTVQVRVQDDGKGFVPSEVGTLREARRSFGLFNIQERAAELDGRLEITSEPGEGTVVSLVLPFGNEGLS